MLRNMQMSALESKRMMECLEVDHVASTGEAVLKELAAELKVNGGDLSKVSSPLLDKLSVAAADYIEMRTNLSNWLNNEFGMYLQLFDLMSSSEVDYSTPIGKVTNALGDVFEP